MIIDIRKVEKELLDDHYLKIINKINKFCDMQRGFILKDLLENGQDDQYHIYLTKGILSSLIYFNFIEIICLYNGKTNFVYRSKKKITTKL